MWSEIEERFRRNALYDGALLILSRVEAMAYVRACRAAGRPIRRIEGFRLLEGGRILPSREHTVDYSAPGAPVGTEVYADALAFLKGMDKELGFEVNSEQSL